MWTRFRLTIHDSKRKRNIIMKIIKATSRSTKLIAMTISQETLSEQDQPISDRAGQDIFSPMCLETAMTLIRFFTCTRSQTYIHTYILTRTITSTQSFDLVLAYRELLVIFRLFVHREKIVLKYQVLHMRPRGSLGGETDLPTT